MLGVEYNKREVKYAMRGRNGKGEGTREQKKRRKCAGKQGAPGIS